MDTAQPELDAAWEELSFWRDFAVWWSAARSDSSEPRVLEILEQAERRYARALIVRQEIDCLEGGC
ncbi:Uncharacterised protein [Halioglobus japonicus]|nr:Uncharacterised protein [Halioglobus japonicus]